MSSNNQPVMAKPGGFLVIDKPFGRSSMWLVANVRRRFEGRMRVGHAGTLDPLATGVMLLAAGSATKLIDRCMHLCKRYVTEVDLSAFTSTDDLEGEQIPVEIAARPSLDDVRTAAQRFVGTILQRPPAFSAVHVGGRRAYALARSGASVDLPERPVKVHSLEVVSYDWPLVTLDVHCGKGFYIRSLARDLGVELGTGGHCTSLRRTAIGPFDDGWLRSIDELPERMTMDELIPSQRVLDSIDSFNPA